MEDLLLGRDNLPRCGWCGTDSLYMEYHDHEWGNPVHDDQLHFEFFLLETQQAGLSWLTILKRRENYRRAFANFDVKKIANFTTDDVDRLCQDASIIRNRRKIEAVVHNARLFLDIQKKEGSFDRFIWKRVKFTPIVNHWKSLSELPVTTELSDQLSKDMKKLGFKFIGSTTLYAHLQAIGVVNDHLIGCHCRK